MRLQLVSIAALLLFLTANAEDLHIRAYKVKENPMLKLTGGYVQRPGTKQGEVAFLNAQQTIPSAAFVPIANRLGKMLHVNFQVKDIADPEVGGFDAAFKKDGAQFAVFVVDDKRNDNTLLILPEKRYAVVNISPLKLDGGEGAFLVARAKKEAARAFFYVAGGASMPVEGNLMSAFMGIRDLDKVPVDAFPVEVIGRVGEYLSQMGCETRAMVTYKKACQEGWAPAPTNDVQKAIWDKVHAMPTEPIKIKPEEKKTER